MRTDTSVISPPDACAVIAGLSGQEDKVQPDLLQTFEKCSYFWMVWLNWLSEVSTIGGEVFKGTEPPVLNTPLYPTCEAWSLSILGVLCWAPCLWRLSLIFMLFFSLTFCSLTISYVDILHPIPFYSCLLLLCFVLFSEWRSFYDFLSRNSSLYNSPAPVIPALGLLRRTITPSYCHWVLIINFKKTLQVITVVTKRTLKKFLWIVESYFHRYFWLLN